MLYTQPPKKMLIVHILDILRRYSDADHRLSQKDILEILRREYETEADRKAIKRNLANLMEAGYPIEYTERIRKNANGEEEILCTDWYLEREFSDSELRLLIDSLLFSRHIPCSQCREPIEKLEGLSNQYFRARVRHVYNLPEDTPRNPQLFWTIETLDEAIEENRQVEFHYADFGTDKKLHPRTGSDGSVRVYRVNPYQMVAVNGRYYLIGNYGNYYNLSHYRLDRIRDIRILDTPAKPSRAVKGAEYGLNLPQHMAEHIYMFAGESRRVTMRTSPGMAGDLIDWFGSEITFSEETEETLLASVTVSQEAMRFWALQYAPYVTILEPKSLAETVKKDLEAALEKYREEFHNEQKRNNEADDRS